MATAAIDSEPHASTPPRGLRFQLRRAGGALLALSLVINLLMLTGPLFMLQVYDRVLASRSVPTLLALTGLIVLLYGYGALLDVIRARLAARVGAGLEEGWAGPLFRIRNQRRLTGDDGKPDPIRDLDSVRQAISGGGVLALLDLPWMPIYLAMVFFLHPVLGWLAVVGAVVICLLLVGSELSSRRWGTQLVDASVKRQRLSDDARANAETIHVMGMVRDIEQAWRRRSSELSVLQLAAADYTGVFSALSRAFRYFLQSAVLAVGAYLVIRGEMTGGVMIGASMISARALAPVDQVVAQWRGLKTAYDAFGRIRETLLEGRTEKPEVDLPFPSHSLVVQNMATGPSRRSGALVSGVTFQLNAGDGLGVLGLSGSGKSSLIRGVTGVWPLLQGEVLLDSAALHQFDSQRLGQYLGYLPQDVNLFEGTIAQNIARYRPDATSEAIIAAARAARVHELILSFRDGYDTAVGQLGIGLSAGQRQRIGLARALFGDPFLIVLDEPNSNLDAVGDEALTASIMAARQRGAIVIVVAHRPSAIASVNKLLYLQDGRQAAFGLKDEVLQQISRPAPRLNQPKVATSG